MNVIRWEPFKEMEHLLRRYAGLGGRLLQGENGEWSPTADISETDKEYLIKAELPEVKKEDVKITLQDGVITLSGERKREREEKGENQIRVEAFMVHSREAFRCRRISIRTMCVRSPKRACCAFIFRKPPASSPSKLRLKPSR